MINKLFSGVYDLTDEIVQGNIEKVAEVVEELGEEYLDTHIPSLEEQGSRDNDDFAVTLHHKKHGFLNKFACYNKNLTALNLKVLEKNMSKLPDEIVKIASTTIKKAANFYGVDFPDTLEEYVDDDIKDNYFDITSLDTQAFSEKLASKKEIVAEYALVERQKYPIQDEELCKQASDYFSTFYREFQVPERIEFATNLNTKLGEFDMEVPDVVEKFANLDFDTLNPDISEHLRVRETYTHDQNMIDLYRELREKTAELKPTTVAIALDRIDKEAGLQYYYGTSIEDPIGAAFSITKEAHYDLDGHDVSQSMYDEMTGKDLSGYIDSDTQEALKGEDGVDVFKSLPSPVREGLLSEVL